MWEKNLKVLEKEYPELAEKVKSFSSDDINYEVEDTKNESKTIKIKKNNKTFYLNSKYNPQNEAKKFIDNNLNFQKIDSIVVLGFGLGYHLTTLLDRVEKVEHNIKIFIIERNISVFIEALKYKDFRQLLEYQNCNLIIGEKQTELTRKNTLFHLINSELNDCVFEDLKLISWQPSIKLNEAYYNEIISEIKEVFEVVNKNFQTFMNAGDIWNQHILENIDHILTTPGYHCLNDCFSDKPIIIVSAGPSLDKNIKDLKLVKDKAVIICVSTALKSLLKEDIIPDIVILIDESENLLGHFEGVDYSKLDDVVLAFTPKVQPKIIDNWRGPKILVCVPLEDYLLQWIEQYTDYKNRIAAGGSVAHYAFVLGIKLGGNPIVLVGQDLAFSGGNTHVNGSPARESIEENKQNNKRRSYFEIEDIHGNEVLTRNDYYSYLKWFNRSIESISEFDEDIDIIDATEGGAKIKGTKIMKLKETINKYCDKKISVKEKLKSKIANCEVSFDRKLIIDLKDKIINIEKLKSLAEKGLYLIDQLIESNFQNDEEKFNNINNELFDINYKISNMKDDMLFFESEFYDMYSERIVSQEDYYLDENSNDEVIKINKLVNFYEKIIKGSNKILDILKNKSKEIKEI